MASLARAYLEVNPNWEPKAVMDSGEQEEFDHTWLPDAADWRRQLDEFARSHNESHHWLLVYTDGLLAVGLHSNKKGRQRLAQIAAAVSLMAFHGNAPRENLHIRESHLLHGALRDLQARLARDRRALYCLA